jgi:type I restriction enzyme S subunit
MKWGGYPEYRDSGVDWLGDVPVGWMIERLRFAIRTNPSKAEANNIDGDTYVSFVPMEAVGEYGGLRLNEARPLNEVKNGFTYFRNGDVLVAKITPCFENGKGAIAAGLENGVGFGTTELHVLRPKQKIDQRYLFYLTISYAFRQIGKAHMYGAGGQKRVPEDFIRNLRHPIPLIVEQRAIATFLDQETERIDSLIAKKERQIELLQEKRTALISHAVAKGLSFLNSASPKESWSEARLGRFIKLQRGFDITGAEELYEGFPVFSSGGLSGYSDVAMVRGPGVIVGRKGTLGTVHYSEGNYWPHDTTLWVKEFRGNHPRFIYYYLMHLKLEQLDVGAANPTLNRNHVHPISVCFPDMDTQLRIVRYLDQKIADIETMVEKVTASIELLREYRTAMISAAVTGKIDIRREVA